jgi:LacI family transcriptional regulator
MPPLLLSPAITALIIPRDRAVMPAYSALTRLGIRIPEDLSLISFDNYLRYSLRPVTTVSIGDDDLGYRAFHAIAGDIPFSARQRLVYGV